MGNNRLVAILSYITLLGWIVALILHLQKKTKLGGFHLRQALILMLTALTLSIVNMILIWIPILGWFLLLGMWIVLFIFWIIGLIYAIQGQMKEVPLIGKYGQDWFTGL